MLLFIEKILFNTHGDEHGRRSSIGPSPIENSNQYLEEGYVNQALLDTADKSPRFRESSTNRDSMQSKESQELHEKVSTHFKVAQRISRIEAQPGHKSTAIRFS